MNSEGTSHLPHLICVFPLAKTAVIMRLSIPYAFGVIEAPTAPDRIILLACKHLLNSLIENIPGIPIRSNLSDEDTENYAALVSQLAIKAHHVVRY